MVNYRGFSEPETSPKLFVIQIFEGVQYITNVPSGCPNHPQILLKDVKLVIPLVKLKSFVPFHFSGKLGKRTKEVTKDAQMKTAGNLQMPAFNSAKEMLKVPLELP
uniref:Uncharacterized protein n=1 Tax=Lygus hesperus TaxID=30085 RepID=A0A0K8S4R9_LYGHE